MRLPRWLAPTALAVAGLGCAGVAVVQEAALPDEADPVDSPVLGTPVLSVRRVPSVVAAPIADRRLRQALAEWAASLPGDQCAEVRIDGEEVLDHRSGEPMVPASVLKLLTATAALDELGPEHRFRTMLKGAAPVDGVVAGDVALVGGGDPLLSTPDYAARFRRQPQIFTDLTTLADAVVDAGIRQINGSVVGDESRYDRERYVAGWPERYITQNQTGPLSALSVNDGFVQFPTPAQWRELVPAPDPAQHAAEVFRNLLIERGVVVTGPPVAGSASPDAAELATVDSPPLDQIVDQLLLESDNMTAELLIKELGFVAGTPATGPGLARMQQILSDIGLGLGSLALGDGSGLSLDNRVTCDLVVDLLDHPDAGPTLLSSIPLAGESGTLSEAFLDTGLEGHLRGKTGRLNSVIGLAGSVVDGEEPDIVFAYLVNVPPGQMAPADEVAAAQVRLGTILLHHPDVPSEEKLGPLPTREPVEETRQE